MLSVHDLNRHIEAKKREKFATYEKVFALCEKHVVRHADAQLYRCFFEVPEFIMGLPVYALNPAIMYIYDKLVRKGFLVKYYFPKVLYISWDLDEISGKKTNLPGMARMIEATNTMAQQQQPALPVPAAIAMSPLFPPSPVSGRSPTSMRLPPTITMPQTPPMDLPLPQASSGALMYGRGGGGGGGGGGSGSGSGGHTTFGQGGNNQGHRPNHKSKFIKSISEYKPSGKFVLDI